MWYLSDHNSVELELFSTKLLKEKGAQFEFDVASRVLTQFKLVVNSYITSGKCDYNMALKEISDSLIVAQHPVNVAGIQWSEVDLYGANTQIPRSYKAVLNIENYKVRNPLQKELDTMSMNILVRNGPKYQMRILAEETGELDKEIMKFNRKYLSGVGAIRYLSGLAENKDEMEKFQKDRTLLVGELFDFLFTMRYLFIPLQRHHKKTREQFFKDLNNCMRGRMTHINNREFGD